MAMTGGPAAAGPITWGPDVFTPSGDVNIAKPATGACTASSILDSCSEFSYAHDLTDHGFVVPLPSSVTLTGGLLELDFSDGDGDKFKLSVEGDITPNLAPLSSFSFTNFSAVVLASLAADGVLNVLIEHQGANRTSFTFLGSTFSLYGEESLVDPAGDVDANLAAVPEPASLLLFGTGLAALAARRRRARR